MQCNVHPCRNMPEENLGLSYRRVFSRAFIRLSLFIIVSRFRQPSSSLLTDCSSSPPYLSPNGFLPSAKKTLFCQVDMVTPYFVPSSLFPFAFLFPSAYYVHTLYYNAANVF